MKLSYLLFSHRAWREVRRQKDKTVLYKQDEINCQVISYIHLLYTYQRRRGSKTAKSLEILKRLRTLAINNWLKIKVAAGLFV